MPEEVTPQHDSAVTKTFRKLATGYGQLAKKKPRPFNVAAEIFLAVYPRTVRVMSTPDHSNADRCCE
jgi:hypothetical protein